MIPTKFSNFKYFYLINYNVNLNNYHNKKCQQLKIISIIQNNKVNNTTIFSFQIFEKFLESLPPINLGEKSINLL